MSVQATLTTFTDPMMGLSWEQEPVYRRLEARFGDALAFRYRRAPVTRTTLLCWNRLSIAVSISLFMYMRVAFRFGKAASHSAICRSNLE